MPLGDLEMHATTTESPLHDVSLLGSDPSSDLDVEEADSRLRGFGLGATARLRGPAVVGFAENAGVFDPSRPYTTSATQDYGAIISYQRKLFRRVDWRLQLNVSNLFESGGLKVQRIVDARDGTGRGVGVIYRVLEPRSYALSSSFTF